MLQAVQRDSNPAPAKTRSGTDSSSDPALGVFAGMMAQAATPARTSEIQPRETPTDRAEPKDASRAAEPADARRAPEGTGAAKGAEKASTAPAQKPESPEPPDAPAKASETPAVGAQEAVALPSQVAVSPGEVPKTAAQAEPAPVAAPVDPNAPAPAKLPAKAEEAPAASLPKELRTTLEPAAEPTESQPKAALRELLHLPKVEIETPKLHPETTAKPQAGPVALSAQASAGQASSDTPDPSAEDAAPAEPTGKVPTNLHAALKLEAPEPAVSPTVTAKHAAPEAAALGPIETIRPAQATVRTEAAAPARPHPAATQVEGSIRWILQNKAQGAELQLHPEALGRVVIQLKVEGQEVHARLWASENSSLAVLQDHKAFLETSLKEQGLVLSTFDLQSGARGNSAQTAFQEQAAPSPRTLPHLEVMQEMPTEFRLDPSDPYRVEVYA